MKKSIIIIFAIALISCNVHKTIVKEIVEVEDNQELIEILEIDQKMRNDETAKYEPIDKKHRKRVFELMADNKIITNNDKFNAAIILQHTGVTYCDNVLKSKSPENYLLAYALSNSAYNSGSQKAANLVATNYDRYLLFTEGYQKYGTQKIYDKKSDSFLWAPIDSLTTDAERVKYNVPDLKTLLEQAKMKEFDK